VNSFNPDFVSANNNDVGAARDPFLNAINDGKAYFNIHTEAHPDGEIRGFLHPLNCANSNGTESNGTGQDVKEAPVILCGGSDHLRCPLDIACCDDPRDQCDHTSDENCFGFCNISDTETILEYNTTIGPFNATLNPIILCGGPETLVCPHSFACLDDPRDNCDFNTDSNCMGMCNTTAESEIESHNETNDYVPGYESSNYTGPVVLSCGGPDNLACPLSFECIDDPRGGDDLNYAVDQNYWGICNTTDIDQMKYLNETRDNPLPLKFANIILCGGADQLKCPNDADCLDDPRDTCDYVSDNHCPGICNITEAKQCFEENATCALAANCCEGFVCTNGQYILTADDNSTQLYPGTFFCKPKPDESNETAGGSNITSNFTANPCDDPELLAFTASLNGQAEDPPTSSQATADHQLEFDPRNNLLHIRITFGNLESPTTAAHIHGPTDNAGSGNASVMTQLPAFADFPLNVMSGTYDHVFDLNDAASFNPDFVSSHNGDVGAARDAFLSAIKDGKAYFNIHTEAYPDGEIRGFLSSLSCPSNETQQNQTANPCDDPELLAFTAFLNGSTEDPPSTSQATAQRQLTFDPRNNQLNIQIIFANLESPTTAAHIHGPTDNPGTGNASIMTQLPAFSGFPLNVTYGTYDHSFDLNDVNSFNPDFVSANNNDVGAARDAFLNAINDGKAYFNIHTEAHPDGEIRGFLHPLNCANSITTCLNESATCLTGGDCCADFVCTDGSRTLELNETATLYGATQFTCRQPEEPKCLASNASCSISTDCCSGICTNGYRILQWGENLTLSAGPMIWKCTCLLSLTKCHHDSECCSGHCDDYGLCAVFNLTNTTQPSETNETYGPSPAPSTCLAANTSCFEASDCCSMICTNGSTVLTDNVTNTTMPGRQLRKKFDRRQGHGDGKWKCGCMSGLSKCSRDVECCSGSCQNAYCVQGDSANGATSSGPRASGGVNRGAAIGIGVGVGAAAALGLAALIVKRRTVKSRAAREEQAGGQDIAQMAV